MSVRLVSDLPSLNTLVNNAGSQHQYDFLKDDGSMQKIDEEVDISFGAVTRLTEISMVNIQ